LKLQQNRAGTATTTELAALQAALDAQQATTAAHGCSNSGRSYESNIFVAPEIGVHWSQICCVFGQSFVCFNLTLFTFTP
jgi:hypothetical protein